MAEMPFKRNLVFKNMETGLTVTAPQCLKIKIFIIQSSSDICFILNTVDSNSTRLNCTGTFIYRFFPINVNYSTRGSDGKSLPAMQETWIRPWVRKGLWRREWLPILIFLPGEFHGQRSLAGYSPEPPSMGLPWLSN